MLLWAGFAKVDEVTRGDGKAIPSSKLQKIQNLEGGIVAELYVKEGQIVEAGAPLIRLDDTRFVSNAGETEAQRLSLLLRIERLNAQVEDRPLNIPEDVRAAAPPRPSTSSRCMKAGASSSRMKSVVCRNN